MCHDAMSMNCECYKKLRLAAVVAEMGARTLVATIEAAAIMLVAIQWYHEAFYISSCVGSLG